MSLHHVKVEDIIDRGGELDGTCVIGTDN